MPDLLKLEVWPLLLSLSLSLKISHKKTLTTKSPKTHKTQTQRHAQTEKHKNQNNPISKTTQKTHIESSSPSSPLLLLCG
jgi:hypothetical protein